MTVCIYILKNISKKKKYIYYLFILTNDMMELSIFCLFICSLYFYEWFLFLHNFFMIFYFWDLFLVEIYRKIKVNLYLLCLNYECFGVKFVKIYPEMTSQLNIYIFFKYY
jgi:hypothetical protein